MEVAEIVSAQSSVPVRKINTNSFVRDESGNIRMQHANTVSANPVVEMSTLGYAAVLEQLLWTLGGINPVVAINSQIVTPVDVEQNKVYYNK